MYIIIEPIKGDKKIKRNEEQVREGIRETGKKIRKGKKGEETQDKFE